MLQIASVYVKDSTETTYIQSNRLWLPVCSNSGYLRPQFNTFSFPPLRYCSSRYTSVASNHQPAMTDGLEADCAALICVVSLGDSGGPQRRQRIARALCKPPETFYALGSRVREDK